MATSLRAESGAVQHHLHADNNRQLQSPWQAWTPEAHWIIVQNEWQVLYDSLQNTSHERRAAQLHGHSSKWFVHYRFDQLPSVGKLFSIGADSKVIQCERCGQLYDRAMNPIPAAPCLIDALRDQIYQMSFVFCKGNIDKQCQQKATPAWTGQVHEIASEQRRMCDQLKTILSWLDPGQLIKSVFGNTEGRFLTGERPNNIGEFQLIMAYRALRVIWIRSFASHQPKPPPTAEDPVLAQRPLPSAQTVTDVGDFVQKGLPTDPIGYRIQMGFGGLDLWGDIKQDLFLFSAGHITEKEIGYVYGIKKNALAYLVDSHRESEIEWLNAFAGLRRRVSPARFQLLRTAVQRLNTAMDRFFEVYKHDLVKIKPSDVQFYAMNGVRFHEVLSALGTSEQALQLGLRAVDKPDNRWWKDVSRVLRDGTHVHVEHIFSLRPLHPGDWQEVPVQRPHRQRQR